MRAGGCSIHQSLTPDAAAIVKQAISLARRRGHAQVTPLHVANTMLSSSTGLLRSACLQSHSHPLQCKALELCFNVALNRLPAASSSSPLLPPQHPPSLSNALIAAFKRAQAHQRRGSIENQQQPLLSVKIELEQLIVSILDDPSVSRVMREAGFSSTQVKSNVEHAISLEPNSNINPDPKRNTPEKTDEDIACLIECLISSKKRSIVVVGECLGSIEGVMKGLMERVDKGQVPEIMRNLQFITLPLLSFSGMSKREVEQKISELKCLLMKNCCVGKGVVLYLEDIKWVAEFRANCYEASGAFYCPVEHVIMEIGRLVFSGINGGEDGGIKGGGRFWLMGISTYQTYMKCKMGNPSLEIVWGLQPLAIPVGSLELSLNCHNCDTESLNKSSTSGAWPILENAVVNHLNCCTNFPIKFEKDAQASTASTLPSWLQHYKENNKKDTKDLDYLNSINRVQSHTSEITLHFSSISPSSSISSYNHHNTTISLNQSHHQWKQNQLWLFEGINREFNNSSRAFPFPVSNSSSLNPNLISTANTIDLEHQYKFKELNAENLKILCNALERKVPWQKTIIPEIASIILQCRAGMKSKDKEDTWLFFQGGDTEGKEKIARELASLIFGYQMRFFAVGLSNSSSTKSDSTDDARNKRSRLEASQGFLEKLVQAMKENPHRVFLVEDIEQVDFQSQVAIKSAIERGSFWSLEGGEVAIKDAIIILSCEAFDSRSRDCSPPIKQKIEREEGKAEEVSEKENDSYLCLDLNLCAMDNESTELWCFGESETLISVVDRAFFFKKLEDF
ncbi:protein SMAX1-LIKE 3 [Phalaenopsis equestris]|uniref:protein SMAX1-LIKE 3 n=1 Tax=Phalaenopsis equestris TaxID=78828 RepID=UPI0009E59BFF|nr:protein SMAX1-LIKE 3 [Phalaenopsis equestris]